MAAHDDAPLPSIFTLLDRSREVRSRYSCQTSENSAPSPYPSLAPMTHSGSVSSQSSGSAIHNSSALPSLSNILLPPTPPPNDHDREREEWRKNSIRQQPHLNAPYSHNIPSVQIRNAPPSPVSTASSSSTSRFELPPLITSYSSHRNTSPISSLGPSSARTSLPPLQPSFSGISSAARSYSASPIVHSPTALSPSSSAPLPSLTRFGSSMRVSESESVLHTPSSPPSSSSASWAQSSSAPSSSSRPSHHHHHLISPTQLPPGFPQPSQDRYVCPTCAKSFSRPSSLRIHSHSHTGEKPFKCSHAGCGKAFSVRSNMKRHERGCHAAAAAAAAAAANDRRISIPDHMGLPLRVPTVGPMHHHSHTMPMSLPHPHSQQPQQQHQHSHPHSFGIHSGHLRV